MTMIFVIAAAPTSSPELAPGGTGTSSVIDCLRPVGTLTWRPRWSAVSGLETPVFSFPMLMFVPNTFVD
jgi:hypothetical protein